MNQSLTLYRRQQVGGASSLGLLTILFQEVTRRIVAARRALRDGDYAEANRHFIRAQDIIYELRTAVNTEVGQISEDLINLYDYVLGGLMRANLSKSEEHLDTILKVLSVLGSAWRELEQQA